MRSARKPNNLSASCLAARTAACFAAVWHRYVTPFLYEKAMTALEALLRSIAGNDITRSGVVSTWRNVFCGNAASMPTALLSGRGLQEDSSLMSKMYAKNPQNSLPQTNNMCCHASFNILVNFLLKLSVTGENDKNWWALHCCKTLSWEYLTMSIISMRCASPARKAPYNNASRNHMYARYDVSHKK